MTNKEAKEKLYMEWQKFLENNIDYAGVSEAYKMAFKALEQESILDKIQEEIKRVDTVCHASNNHDELIRRNVVLQILDKYKAESEDKE